MKYHKFWVNYGFGNIGSYFGQYPNFTENENEVKSDNQYKNMLSTCLKMDGANILRNAKNNK